MRRLLALLMMITFVVVQGSSVAAAICRHQSPLAHALARESADRRISAAAMTEETADSVASKKGGVHGSGSVSWLIDILPPLAFALLPRPSDGLKLSFAADPPLTGTLVQPLIRPPLA